MPDGGRVVVELSAVGGRVALTVKDEGNCIPEAQRSRIFDLFYTTKERGTGLGLPLTRQIVVAHGGLIRCEGGPGEGTTFELLFPAVRENLESQKSRDDQEDQVDQVDQKNEEGDATGAGLEPSGRALGPSE